MKKNVLGIFLICFLAISTAFAAAPTITAGTTGLSPTSAKAGETVTIKGTNLATVSIVRFGGVAAASFTVKPDGTELYALPSINGNSGFIYVENPDGNFTNNSPFTFLPTITNPLVEGDVVINKLYNADDTDGSGDAIEILVIKDHADLRGLYFKDWRNGKNGGTLTYFFKEIALFSDVRAGTLIVARNSPTSTDASFTTINDFNLDLGLQDLNYFIAGNKSTTVTDYFDIGKDDFMSLQKSPSGTTGLIAMFGSGPTVVNLLSPLTTSTVSSFNQSFYTRLNGSTTTTPGKFVYVTNRNSTYNNYRHAGAAANTQYNLANNADRVKSDVTMNDDPIPVALALGTANNATNLAYITALRVIGITLPVNLISFTAKKSTTGIELNWATASEQNNNRFELQRSADGNSFTVIKTIAGANNSNTRNNYSFKDMNPLSGVNYYQLVQIDNDGTSKNLGIQAVNSDLKSVSFSVYSYGDANQISYTVYATATGNASIKVFDGNGNQVANTTISLTAGNNNLELATTGLKSGVYVAVLMAENNNLTTKFIK